MITHQAGDDEQQLNNLEQLQPRLHLGRLFRVAAPSQIFMSSAGRHGEGARGKGSRLDSSQAGRWAKTLVIITNVVT